MSIPSNPYASPSSEVSGAKIEPAPQDRIEVMYSNTYFDLAWDRVGLYWRNPVLIVLFLVAAIGLPLSDSFDKLGRFHGEYFFPMAGQMTLIVIVGGMVVNLLILVSSATRGSAEAVFGPFRLELSDEGVTRETSTERWLVKWRGIRAIRKNAWTIRIYQTPTAYVLLPRRAFVLEQDAENFYLTAERFLQQAKSSNPPKS